MGKNEILRQPWFLRKLLYTLATLVGLMGVAVGLLTPEAGDAFAGNVEPLITLGLTLVTALAGVKTHRGSDSLLTEADVKNVTT